MITSYQGIAAAVKRSVCVHISAGEEAPGRQQTGGEDMGASVRAQWQRYSATKAKYLKLSGKLNRSPIYWKFRCLAVGHWVCHV